MSNPKPNIQNSGSSGSNMLDKTAAVSGGLYDLKALTKNLAKTPQVNDFVPKDRTVTVRQPLVIFTEFQGDPIDPPKPGAMKINQVTPGFVLQDAQVNSNGEVLFTFLNQSVAKGVDGQVAAIQLMGDVGKSAMQSGALVTFLFALK